MARVSRKVRSYISEMQPDPDPVRTASKHIYRYQTVLYLRLSNEELEGNPTEKIKNQKELLLNYTNSRNEHEIVGIYCDNGRTGRNFNRPKWMQLMEDVRCGRVNCIIVKDLSRLGRNYIEAGNYLEKVFPFMGIRFIAIADGYDSEDRNGNLQQLMLPLKNIINDTYSKDLSRKIRSARRIQRQKGEFTGGKPPYGYRRDKNNKGHFVIDADEAPVVRRIFQCIADGCSYSKTARELNAEGIPSASKGLWSYQSIRVLIRNEAYIGTLIQGKDCVAGSDIVKIENAHEAIIEKGLFDQVQECRKRIQDDFQKPGKLDTDEYIFSGLLIDGSSKKKMGKVHYFKNNGKEKVKAYKSVKAFDDNGIAYKLTQIKEETLLNCIEETLYKYIVVLDAISDFLRAEKVKNYYHIQILKMNRTIEAQKSQLLKVKEYLADAYEDMIEGAVSEKDYILYREKYLNDQARLENEIIHKEKIRDSFHETVLMENPYIKHLKGYRENPELTKNLLELLVDHIVVNSSREIEIVFSFQNEFEALQKLCPAGLGWEEAL